MSSRIPAFVAAMAAASALSYSSPNVHVFRNDGKYNVYDKDSIENIKLGATDNQVDFYFKNGAKYDAEISAVDSLVFIGDTCLISEINIVTEDGLDVTSKTEYQNCTININGHNIFDSDILSGKIRGRGNSTWLWYDKKPYRIKLDKKSKMLGLKKGKSFVLLANYRDPTFMMNAFAFEMADYLDMPFSNHSRFCNLYINGEFKGLYMLTEQIQQGNNRVEIDEDKGILLSLDVDDGPGESPDADDNFYGSITTTSSSSSQMWGGRPGGNQQQTQTTQIPVCIKYPEDSVMLEKKSAIQDSFAVLTSAIQNHDYAAFKTLMDVQSYIDFILIQEMTYNVELEAPRSMYMYKNDGNDSLWHMGPVWDFDGGFFFDWTNMTESRNYFTNNSLLLGSDPVSNPNGVNPFFTCMFNDSDFKADFLDRWNQVKDNMLPMLFAKLDNYKLQINCSMQQDQELWNLTTDFDTQFQNLKNWISEHYKLMDKCYQGFAQ